MLMPPMEGTARTVLLDPISGAQLVEPIVVKCLSLRECLAEKFRAALCRRDVAIRDFFDIDYAVHRQGVVTVDSNLREMIRLKVAVPGNDPPSMSQSRMAGLSRQVETHLKPVLREADLAAFDLDRVINTVESAGKQLV